MGKIRTKMKRSRFCTSLLEPVLRRILCLSLSIVLAATLLTGCLQINIGIGIDDRYTSYLTYEIEMDVSEVDPQYHEILSRALNSLGWHYQEELGFVVGLDTDTDAYKLTMRKSEANESLPDAFKTLEAMLTNEEMTPFMRVDMFLASFPEVDSYIINAMLDIGQLIERSGAEELPPDLQLELEEALETSGGAIKLTMPASEIVESSHDVDKAYILATMEIPLDINGQTEFELRANAVYSDYGIEPGSIDELTARLEHTRTMILVICAAALALLLIILTAVLLTIRKHNKMFD